MRRLASRLKRKISDASVDWPSLRLPSHRNDSKMKARVLLVLSISLLVAKMGHLTIRMY